MTGVHVEPKGVLALPLLDEAILDAFLQGVRGSMLSWAGDLTLFFDSAVPVPPIYIEKPPAS
jgi:hypothetical protein